MIKKSFLNAIRNDLNLKQQLAAANQCTLLTIGKWLRNEDVIFTTVSNLEIIKKHFGLLEVSELLESSEAVKG